MTVAAIVAFFAGDLLHAGWHYFALGLGITDLAAEMAIAMIMSLAVVVVLTRIPCLRLIGAGVDVLAGLYSLARGLSGSAAGEGLWIHVLLGASGLPLAAIGVRLLRNSGQPTQDQLP